jgi:ankyrin repeat protein
MLAAEAGHLEAARALLESRASVHVKDALSLWDHESGPTGLTALGNAVRSDDPDPELVSLLLDAGAYPDARDESGATPMIRAAFLGKSEIVKRLLGAGADANSPACDERGMTALEAAAMFDDATVYHLVRDAGAEPGDCGKLPEALQFAVFRGATSVVDGLLADGVDVNAETSAGATALTSAAMMGRLEIARKLLDHGADPDGGAAGSDRPLHRAAMMGHTALVRLLLDHGADPNALGSENLTPLLALAREGGRMPIGNPSGLPACARALLAAGADAHARADGRTALAIAMERGYEGLIAILREAVSGGTP